MANRITVTGTEQRFREWEMHVKKRVIKILSVMKKDGVAIDIVLLGNRKMRTLNRRHRGKDKSTNVLSFEEPKQFVYPDKGATPKGEIYLNPEMAREWWRPKGVLRSPELVEGSGAEGRRLNAKLSSRR